MKLIICCFLLIVMQSSIAFESSNWAHNLDNCEIRIKNKRIILVVNLNKFLKIHLIFVYF